MKISPLILQEIGRRSAVRYLGLRATTYYDAAGERHAGSDEGAVVHGDADVDVIGPALEHIHFNLEPAFDLVADGIVERDQLIVGFRLPAF